MTRTTYSFAIAVATAAACLVAGGGVAAAKPCVPVAHITGDTEVVNELTAALEERSVTVEEADDCVVTARVTKDEKHIIIRVIDADGRRAERSADNIEVAATIIESWVRYNLALPLLVERDGPARPRRGPAKEPVLVAGASTERTGIDLGAGGVVGLGLDGSQWGGAQVNGCFSVGRMCVGALVRYSVDLETKGDAVELDSSRTLLDTLVTVEVPLERGGFRFTPGVGVGQSMLRASGIEHDEEEDDELDEDTAGIRVRAHAAAAFDLSTSWSLRGDAAIGWVGFATREFGDLDEMEGDDDRLAGMPEWHTWFGISLVYGGL